VSMPFFGLLSFLRKVDYDTVEYISVSMPFFGLLSFLPTIPDDFVAPDDVCQCPSSGFSLFYVYRFLLYGLGV